MSLSRMRQRNDLSKSSTIIRIEYQTGAATETTYTSSVGITGEKQWINDVGPEFVASPFNGHKTKNRLSHRRRIALDLASGRKTLHPVRIVKQVQGLRKRTNGHGEIPAHWVPSKRYFASARGAILAKDSMLGFQLPYTYEVGASVDPKWSQYLLAKAMAKVSQPKHDFGVTLAELAETLALLVSPFRALQRMHEKLGMLGGKFRRVHNVGYNEGGVRFIPHPYSHRKKELLKTVKSVSGVNVVDESTGIWLAYRYGVQPLIGEIQSILNLLGSKLDPDGEYGMARSGYTHPLLSNAGEYANYITFSTFHYKAKWTVETSRISRAMVYYRNTYGSPMLSYLEKLGLSPFQIPSLAYEVVPCSFMLDWFLDVGSWIRGITPHPNQRVLGCCASIAIKSICRKKIVDVWNNTSYLHCPSKVNDYLCGVNHYTRTLDYGVPLYPVVNPKLLDISRKADILGVIWQRLPYGR